MSGQTKACAAIARNSDRPLPIFVIQGLGLLLVLALGSVGASGDSLSLLQRLKQIQTTSPGQKISIDLHAYGRTQELRGDLLFVGAPGLPDYFGLRDTDGVLHLLKADPDFVFLPPMARPAPRSHTIHPVNSALNSPRDFRALHADPEIQEFLRLRGYGELVDREIRPFTARLQTFLLANLAGNTTLTMVYLTFLDSAGPLYIGEFGPNFIMNHLSSWVGSAALGSTAMALGPTHPTLNRFWRITLGSALTYAQFAIENPLGLQDFKYLSVANVQDPADFMVGTAAAWLTVMMPELAHFYDRVQAKFKSFIRSQKSRCGRWLFQTPQRKTP